MQTLRASLALRCLSLSRPLCSQRWASSWSAADLQTIKTKLVSQPPKIIDDFLTPTQSHLLSLSLTGASRSLEPCARPSPYASASFAQPLPYGAHLVHFPIRATPQELYPDGTDADHLPHELLPKRMWEGGEVQYSPTWRRQLIMDGRRAVCVETIGDVRLARNSQYMLVDVWRSYTAVDGCRGAVDVQKALDNAAVRERRTLVFMPKDTDIAAVRRRPVKCPWTPQYTQVFTPSDLTLFNFSALTYNAHRIHYTSGYDGFSRPVVHGPLTQALMLHVLNSWLPDINIESLKYSNVAPLFAGDRLSVCLARRDGAVRLWITGPDGGMAVKGTAIEAGSE